MQSDKHVFTFLSQGYFLCVSLQLLLRSWLRGLVLSVSSNENCSTKVILLVSEAGIFSCVPRMTERVHVFSEITRRGVWWGGKSHTLCSLLNTSALNTDVLSQTPLSLSVCLSATLSPSSLFPVRLRPCVLCEQ